MKANIFVVESPLQMMSATEAALSNLNEAGYKVQNILIIRFGRADRVQNNIHMKKLQALFDWDYVIDYTDPNVHSIFVHLWRRLKIEQISRRFINFDVRLYIGEFRAEWMHFLRHSVEPEATYLLDDGAVTIQVQREYLAKGMFFPKLIKRSKVKQFINDLIYFGLLKDNVFKDKLNLFTVFNLQSHQGQLIHQHSYENLRKLILNSKSTFVPEVWLFGSKYSEAGILARKAELNLLNKVVQQLSEMYPDAIVKYIPHRDENEDKLELIKKTIDVEVKPLNMPAEIYMLENGVKPLAAGGYYTTALMNLKVLEPHIVVTSFRIPNNLISSQFKSSIANVYTYIEESGIDVIEIN